MVRRPLGGHLEGPYARMAAAARAGCARRREHRENSALCVEKTEAAVPDGGR